MSSIQVGLRVPPTLYKKLECHAEQIDASKTEIILTAIAQYLNSAEDAPLSVRVTELEKRVVRLENIVKKD